MLLPSGSFLKRTWQELHFERHNEIKALGVGGEMQPLLWPSMFCVDSGHAGVLPGFVYYCKGMGIAVIHDEFQFRRIYSG